MEKLLIVDGHNLLFRMFYGMQQPIYNERREDVRAVLGFTNNLLNIISKSKPERVFVAFDSETSTEDRLELYEGYKQNRIDYSQVPDDENPFLQLPMILKVLDHVGIAFREIRTCEADDFIATLAKTYEESHKVTILSTDRDFLQLVSEKIAVYAPRGKNSVYFTEDKVLEKFSVKPDQIVDYKTLVGDASDNIKGVKGIGPKTAVKILKSGTLDDILLGQTDLEEKYFKKLKSFEEEIGVMKQLVTMKLDVPLDLTLEDMAVEEIEYMNARKVLVDCGIF